MLKINDLKVCYKTKDTLVEALGPLTLEVNSGDTYAIIGPSGCGKSSLLKAIGGIVSNFSGSITLNGEKINQKNLCIWWS